MALIPPLYSDAVVSIGYVQKDKYKSLATGFLVGFSMGKNPEGQPIYKTFLVTNRHVFEGKKDIYLRFNLNEGNTKTYRFPLEDDKGRKWSSHNNPMVDIAAVGINMNFLLSEEKVKCTFIQEENMAFLDTIKAEGIAQGDGVFVLGFPLGLAGDDQNYVIVKGGIISRLDDEIIKRQSAFMIDSNIFPGNSGGPVILRPEITHLEGTKAVGKAYLIGVISGYIAYQDEAVSRQTNQVRVVFNENSGLAMVVPMDFVKETVRDFMKVRKEEAEPKQVDLEGEQGPIKLAQMLV